MKIKLSQLRRLIREQIEQELEITPEQRKIAKMFTRFDRAQVTQALELNKTLEILPEPTNISFPHEDWVDMTDEERREREDIPIDKYPNDFPMQPRVLVDIEFATAEDAELWKNLWVEEAGACVGAGLRGCNGIVPRQKNSFWIWEPNP